MLINESFKSKWLPTLSQRDRRVLNIVVPFGWVVLGWGAYLSFTKGNIGEGIGHTGLLIVLFATMVGPQMWAVVADGDAMLKKVLAIIIAFGTLTMATGWLIRLAT